MHFSILLFHESMHFWNNSWGISQNSFVTAFLITLVLKKCVSLIILLTTEKGKVTWSKIWRIKSLLEHYNVFLRQKLPDALRQCVQVHYCVAFPQI